MAYKLSIVRSSDGAYLVNYYPKIPDKHLPDFACVINRLFDYTQNPEIFAEQPILVLLSKEEEKAVNNIRNLVLEQRVLG